MNQQASVAVVILNFNTRELLEKFLPSVEASTYKNFKIVVADNASSDDSVAWLRANKPNIELIELDENHGYAGGYNRALEEVLADYYVLLNSDVEVEADWLEALVARAEDDAKIAAIQPKIRAYKDKSSFEYAGASGGFLDLWGYPFCRGRIFDELEGDTGQYDEAIPVFWATGASLFIRSDAFHASGGFDENFFAHMEEIDLCWRLQHLGYSLWVEPKSTVYHLGGGTLNTSSARKYYLNYRNNLAMLTKNLNSKFWFVKILWKMVLDGVSAINFLLGGRADVFVAIIKAHLSFWKRLRYWIEMRKVQHRSLSDSALYPHSIVRAYFLQNRRKYSELKRV